MNNKNKLKEKKKPRPKYKQRWIETENKLSEYKKQSKNEIVKLQNEMKNMKDNMKKMKESFIKLLEEKDKELNKYKNKPKNKGSRCSEEGTKYEKKVHNVIKNSYIDNNPFNIQEESDLGGSTSKNDIECIFKDKNIGIEVKKETPDWMQCSIKFNKETLKWEGSKKGKIPVECRDIFNKLINDVNLYGGDIPPFMLKKIKHTEWIKIKSETNKWDDHYKDIPSDTIRKLYSIKGCYYIQINNYGLYHLGNDICNFGVPQFDIEQRLRFRPKIHNRINKQGFCNLSVTAACQPKNIRSLPKSKYSLDDKDKLPPNLIYKI